MEMLSFNAENNMIKAWVTKVLHVYLCYWTAGCCKIVGAKLAQLPCRMFSMKSVFQWSYEWSYHGEASLWLKSARGLMCTGYWQMSSSGEPMSISSEMPGTFVFSEWHQMWAASLNKWIGLWMHGWHWLHNVIACGKVFGDAQDMV